jgi:hypothetical protein
MPQQRTKPNQQPTCDKNEQDRINTSHAATINRTESTTAVPQRATESDYSADMPQQATEPHQRGDIP